MLRTLEHTRTVGYTCVGAVLIAVGIVLLVLAKVLYPPIINTTADVITVTQERIAFRQDKRADSLFTAGIAILTTGALLLFGFALPEFAVLHDLRKQQAFNRAVNS